MKVLHVGRLAPRKNQRGLIKEKQSPQRTAEEHPRYRGYVVRCRAAVGARTRVVLPPAGAGSIRSAVAEALSRRPPAGNLAAFVSPLSSYTWRHASLEAAAACASVRGPSRS